MRVLLEEIRIMMLWIITRAQIELSMADSIGKKIPPRNDAGDTDDLSQLLPDSNRDLLRRTPGWERIAIPRIFLRTCGGGHSFPGEMKKGTAVPRRPWI